MIDSRLYNLLQRLEVAMVVRRPQSYITVHVMFLPQYSKCSANSIKLFITFPLFLLFGISIFKPIYSITLFCPSVHPVPNIEKTGSVTQTLDGDVPTRVLYAST